MYWINQDSYPWRNSSVSTLQGFPMGQTGFANPNVGRVVIFGGRQGYVEGGVMVSHWVFAVLGFRTSHK